MSRRGPGTFPLARKVPHGRADEKFAATPAWNGAHLAATTAAMPIRTRRWNDPKEAGDGLRLLICRYRPRALPKARETWDAWEKELGPSRDLHAAFYGKSGPPLGWPEYRERYLQEMHGQAARIEALAERVRKGETLTLLCSRACEDEERCHRSLLRALIEKAVAR